jgi:methylenetetrahydrofolate dehydrogenase (NADP+)/methenyltetrahydrofolate cyclohydrolase
MSEISDQIIFDGRGEAKKIETSLIEEGMCKDKNLVIIQCDGELRESTYVRLKKEMGERLGVKVMVMHPTNIDNVKNEVIKANEDGSIKGILVQLPIIGASKEETEQILSTIAISKDIDGLNPKSSFVPAVVMAVETVLEKINLSRDKSIAVVGSAGQVGTRLYDRLLEIGFVVSGFDMGDDLNKLVDFDVVIGCTGSSGLIKPEMVKVGFVGIDLGFPTGDISREAIEKASIITPVPGGVGPLTIVSLYENLAKC